MRIFDMFKKKKEELPEAVKRVFDVMGREFEGRKLTDEAISYRNLGDYEKALTLLHRALTEFKYAPAATLIGTTAVIKGDIDGAIRWFELQIKERGAANDLPLIELYANLGSIYNKFRRDYAKALQVYEMALKAPRPGIYDDQAYALMVSNVYHDIAVVYWTLKNNAKAREYAEARLRIQPDCPDCQKIIEQLTRQEKLQPVNEVRQRNEQAQIIHVRDGVGDVWSTVQIAGGRATIYGNDTERAFVSLLLSQAVAIAALKLSPVDKADFCYCANLPIGHWEEEHYRTFAIGFVHWIANGAAILSEVSPESASWLEKVTKLLRKEQLPDMPRPLDSKAGEVFARRFRPNGLSK
jgi:tetratricopeptide (TPR) repeat protein